VLKMLQEMDKEPKDEPEEDPAEVTHRAVAINPPIKSQGSVPQQQPFVVHHPIAQQPKQQPVVIHHAIHQQQQQPQQQQQHYGTKQHPL
jgi:hypothetical protein